MAEVTLETKDGLKLEAELDVPERVRAVLVLCHPHPKMGGTMDAPLLLALRDELMGRGWAVLRFNFRGIGASGGEASTGIEEQKDARAAIEEARRRWPREPVAVAGWSFGAAVAVRVAQDDPSLAACLAIAPAVKEKPDITAGLPERAQLKMPVLFIVGENDDLVPPADCMAWTEANGGATRTMPGANHFFWGKYEPLAREASDFLDGAIG